MKSIFKLILVLAFALDGQAFAEDAAQNACPQPIQPNRQSSDIVIKAFNKHMTAYIACVKKFVEDQRELAKNATDSTKANAANDVAEAKVAEFNAFMEKIQAANSEEE